MTAVFRLDIPSTQKFVLLVMADAAGDDGGHSFQKVSTICKKTSLKESTVREALSTLRRMGYLEIEQSSVRGKATTYRVLMPSCPPVDRPLPSRPLPTGGLTSSTQRIDLQHVAKTEDVSLMNQNLLTVLEPSEEIVPVSLWLAFAEMRKKIRKPMTDHAGELIRRELRKLKEQGDDPIEVLEQSIRNSWQDVYPLKKDRPTKGTADGDGTSRKTFDAIRRETSVDAIRRTVENYNKVGRDVHGTKPQGNKRIGDGGVH